MEHAFHPGERAVQRRFGVESRLAEIGSRVLRDHMPEQHRGFFAQLPFVLAGSVDAGGQPWASVLAGPAGFVQSPDERTLRIDALPAAGDPLAATLVPGASLGLLGLEPHTRRRNRANGVVERIDERGFTLHVEQSFGNCPKYIVPREARYAAREATPAAPWQGEALDAAALRLVGTADTLFIASAFTRTGDGERSHGVDVSHRGGPPGFVRIEDERTLVLPDYVGNFFFNTLGNLLVNPRAGLLFIDRARGDLLYVAARAALAWDGAAVDATPGAERLLRLDVQSVRRVEAALPIAWSDAAA